MRIEEKVTQAIVHDLQTLSPHAKSLLPSVICNIETATLKESLQICASFLKTRQSETVDLCIVFRRTDIGIAASADLVRGKSGIILSEMPSILLPHQETAEEFDRFSVYVKEYILSQESTIIQELNRNAI